MTREEAIKELSYIADEMPSMECADWKEAISMAIKALEKEPRWIPVTERLPEEEGFYLVTRRITDDVATFIFRRTPTSKGYWKRCVTAWMPLPKPYEGGQEDGKA